MTTKEQSLLEGLIWREDKPGRWLADGYMILEERRFPATIEAALEERPVFSWKADLWLFRDMKSEPTLEAAKAAAEAHFIALKETSNDQE